MADPLARTEDIHESTLRVMAIQRQIKLLNLRVALAAEKRHAAKMQAELLQLRIQQLELDSEQTSLLSRPAKECPHSSSTDLNLSAGNPPRRSFSAFGSPPQSSLMDPFG